MTTTAMSSVGTQGRGFTAQSKLGFSSRQERYGSTSSDSSVEIEVLHRPTPVSPTPITTTTTQTITARKTESPSPSSASTQTTDSLASVVSANTLDLIQENQSDNLTSSYQYEEGTLFFEDEYTLESFEQYWDFTVSDVNQVSHQDAKSVQQQLDINSFAGSSAKATELSHEYFDNQRRKLSEDFSINTSSLANNSKLQANIDNAIRKRVLAPQPKSILKVTAATPQSGVLNERRGDKQVIDFDNSDFEAFEQDSQNGYEPPSINKIEEKKSVNTSSRVEVIKRKLQFQMQQQKLEQPQKDFGALSSDDEVEYVEVDKASLFENERSSYSEPYSIVYDKRSEEFMNKMTDNVVLNDHEIIDLPIGMTANPNYKKLLLWDSFNEQLQSNNKNSKGKLGQSSTIKHKLFKLMKRSKS